MRAPGDNVSNIAVGYSGYDPVSLEPRAAQRKSGTSACLSLGRSLDHTVIAHGGTQAMSFQV